MITRRVRHTIRTMRAPNPMKEEFVDSTETNEDKF